MSTSGLLGQIKRARIVVLFVALLLVFGLVSYPRSADTRMKQLYSIGLGGVTGAANNTVLVFGRYVLVAPFAPTKGISDDGYLDLNNLDNSALLLVDAKKPSSPLITKDMKSWDPTPGHSKTVFFPTRVAYDDKSSNVYVRGLRFEESDDGDVTPVDVIAYVNLHQDSDGTPKFDNNVVLIDIPRASTKRSGSAPLYFAVSGQGDLLVFTNGATVYSYNLVEGYIQELGIVDSSDYGANDSISYLNVDPATNIVSICRNREISDESNQTITTSELSFYRLGQYGSFQLLKHVNPEDFPDGAALAAGSNVAIVSDPDKEGSAIATFVTRDGSLCTVDLGDEGTSTTARRINKFQELAQNDDSDSSPILVSYDTASKTIGIVKPGFTVQISRPSNGRGRISRPSNIHIASGQPVFAMARLNKKNKVSSAKAFTDAFRDEGGLSNFVSDDNAQWLISTYSGNLYSVTLGDDLKDSTLGLIGPLGSNVDRIDYYSDRSSLVAISSFAMDPDGIRMSMPGSLVVVKLSQSSGDAMLQALLPTAYALGRQAPSIRRPSNVRR